MIYYIKVKKLNWILNKFKNKLHKKLNPNVIKIMKGKYINILKIWNIFKKIIIKLKTDADVKWYTSYKKNLSNKMIDLWY